MGRTTDAPQVDETNMAIIATLAHRRFISVFCILNCVLCTSCIFLPTSGTIFPDGAKACTGQSLNLTFRPFNPGDLGTVRLQMDGVHISSFPPRIIDDMAVFTVTIDDDTEPQTPKDDLKVCCFTHWDCTSLKIYNKPEPVVNFTCIAYDEDDTVVCTWILGKKYNWEIKPRLTWRTSGSSEPWRHCPDQRLTSCTWSGTQQRQLYTIDIRVEVPCECGINAISNYTIDTRTIVMPEPALDVEAVTLNSTCLQITWSVSRTTYMKAHRVVVSSKWNDTQVRFHNDTDTTNDVSNKHFFVMCGLHPSTAYTCSVAILPQTGGYYSRYITTTTATQSDIPSLSPSVIPGSFEWYRPSCLNSRYRFVTIYWQPVPEVYQNGPLRAYILSSDGRRDGRREVSEVPGDITSHKLYLLCDETYSVHIQARNDVGTSVHESRVVIPSATSAPPQDEFIVEVLNKTTDGRPMHVAVTLIRGSFSPHRIFFCEKGPHGMCRNTEPIKWLPGERKETILEIPRPANTQFGVSTSVDGSYSGFAWNYCLYSRYQAPSSAPDGLMVQPGPDDNTLYVTWNKMSCLHGDPYISKYIVQYCLLDGDKHCSNTDNVTVIDGLTSVLLPRLQSGVSYKVRVRGVSNIGLKGPLSNPVYGLPENNNLTTNVIVSIVIGSIIIAIPLAVGVGCLIRKCHKKICSEPPVKDLMPANIEEPEDTHISNNQKY